MRVFFVVLLLAACGFVVTRLLPSTPVDGDATSAVAAAAPRVAHTTWIWHYGGADTVPALPIFRRLADVAPRDVDAVVVTATASIEAEARRALGDRTAAGRAIRYVRTSSGKPFTSWARDPYTFLERGRGLELLALPRDVVKVRTPGDHEAAPALEAAFPGLAVRRVPFTVEGGDLTLGGRRAFVGVTTLQLNEDVRKVPPTKLLRELRRLFAREVVVIGRDAETVPLYHHDMFFTPLDEDTVALGDPTLAIPAVFEDSGASRRVTLPGLGEFRLADQERRVVAYREIAADLESQGLRVVRLPILHGVDEGPKIPGVVLSWNNVLLHEVDGEKHVFLPTYGVGKLDALARRLWSSWGYRPHAVSVRETARHGGALRCLTNVMRRGPTS